MRKIHRFRRDVARDAGMQDLFNELSDMRTALEDAYLRFNTTTEPELVDACVYEINAAQSRYNYLLRLIKDAGGEAAFKAYSGREDVAWV
ncbi:MAG: DUF2508 family protein [Oscillospiraceae bacterium]|nr:DUF2508 family protein [Oscillospiraceae bacterium]